MSSPSTTTVSTSLASKSSSAMVFTTWPAKSTSLMSAWSTESSSLVSALVLPSESASTLVSTWPAKSTSLMSATVLFTTGSSVSSLWPTWTAVSALGSSVTAHVVLLRRGSLVLFVC
ncbi:hypothetical protein EAE99_005222 [Botrytis elliptica]|nr:hypothetical protein EAE99_005222 [Botrytis elliptica]